MRTSTISEQFGFYAILTDPVKGYIETTKMLIDNGIQFVQLRMKKSSELEICRIAYTLCELTEGTLTKLIINDYPRIARTCGADGVHVGQTDMPYDEVRQYLGYEKIIGISTHSPQQTKSAVALNPDYIGIGPVYPTPTKVIADPVIGIDGLKEMLSLATIPAVAIGGIDLTNIREVLDAGAVNFCMVRQLTHSENPEKTIGEIKKIYNEYYPGFY
ncbi:MAG TPA: thiamine phosphate synthase [Chitinispirillaceae bacterium]|nr:thiamine phosphate synthase [Chitinispirillaceae bacterium]